MIDEAVAMEGGNVSRVAKRLGIGRVKLYRKLQASAAPCLLISRVGPCTGEQISLQSRVQLSSKFTLNLQLVGNALDHLHSGHCAGLDILRCL